MATLDDGRKPGGHDKQESSHSFYALFVRSKAHLYTSCTLFDPYIGASYRHIRTHTYILKRRLERFITCFAVEVIAMGKSEEIRNLYMKT